MRPIYGHIKSIIINIYRLKNDLSSKVSMIEN